ncbi:hypothetical protein [Dermatobacter hominis]|uniref:hypothetical protein n=1 Tax=Dermatobacter hominis TaxID=2884263 RepID=UPI001D111279|nr:hypothetical protein [Dermatobacter hominis]UDY35691.1 hypothetical protein LH044_20490 [Dermatobacter hominis]
MGNHHDRERARAAARDLDAEQQPSDDLAAKLANLRSGGVSPEDLGGDPSDADLDELVARTQKRPFSV